MLQVALVNVGDKLAAAAAQQEKENILGRN